MTSDFKSVPVFDVHDDNFKDVWPSLTLAIKSSTFVAIDTELSGLGDRRRLNAKSIDDRYSSIRDTAKSRSIISLGISCFKLDDTADTSAQTGALDSHRATRKQWNFVVQTFNIVVLCADDYIVEPSALKFLISHGFDFNKQYSKGLSYYRGNDKNTKPSLSVRGLFSVLIESCVPVVFHNALVDLAFLYQSFYADLPSTSTTFLADLHEMFNGGIYDTKYVAEYKERLSASYLEFVYRKCQRMNSFVSKESRTQVYLHFLHYPAGCGDISWRPCCLPTRAVELGDLPDLQHLNKLVCRVFASYGWCSKGSKCPQSHDIDQIIDQDGYKLAKKSKRRKRKHGSGSHNLEKTESDTSQGDANSDDAIMVDQTSTDGVSGDILPDDQTSTKGVSEDILPDDQTSTEGVSRDIVPDDETSTEVTSNNIDASSVDLEAMHSEDISEENLHSRHSLSNDRMLNGDSNGRTDEGRIGGHRAGYDAFMTGFSMACFISKYGTGKSGSPLADFGVKEWRNKVYLSGKDIPLSVTQSTFSKTSKDHREKIRTLRTNST